MGSEGGKSLSAMQARTKESPGQSRLERSQATPGAEPVWGSWQPAAASPACGCLLAHIGVRSYRHAQPATTAAWPPCSSAGQLLQDRVHPAAPGEADPPLGSARAPRAPAQAGEALRSHPKLLVFSFCVDFSWPETELLILKDSSFCSSCHLYVCVFPLPP